MAHWLNYFKYFLYLGINWNFRLAFFIVNREVEGEKKYQLNTTGIDDLAGSVSQEDRKHASIYQPINFFSAEMLFDQLDDEDFEGTFLDVGCGKGRALAIAAAYGFKKIIGVDFSPALCHEAIQQCDIIEITYPGSSIIIECDDARNYDIDEDVSVIFLFNPFDGFIMKDFLLRVKDSLALNPRRLKILYANPQCKSMWLEAGFEETFQFKKMKYLEGSVLLNRMD